MTIQSIKLTDTELGAVFSNGKVKIKRPVAMAKPLQQRIVNDLATDWRFDGLWRIKDGRDNCYYIERINREFIAQGEAAMQQGGTPPM
jgi:hypothetical protein